MTRRISLLLFLLMISLSGFSQEKVAGADAIQKFLKTTTCVVLDNNIFDSYNSAIKKAVKESWTITPVEFVSQEDFNQRKFDDKYSFLMITKDYYKDDADKMSYKFISVLLGGKYGAVYHMPTLASFPLSYYENADYEFYNYKFGPIVKFLQNHINLTKSDPSLTEKNIILYYNKNVSALGSKTLYVVKSDLASDVNTEAKVKENYSKPFKIVAEHEDLEEVIDQGDNNTVFVHKVGPPKGSPRVARCFNIVMGVDGKIYYFDFHKISGKSPDGFLKSDFKKLAKQ